MSALLGFVLSSPPAAATAASGAPDNGAGAQWGAPGWGQVPQIEKSITVPTFPDRDYTVTEFGAVGDGTTDARPAITAAIHAANSAGGGRVTLPAGTWFSKGPIHLMSNVDLHVSDGATLRFSQDATDYLPQVLTRWEGTDLYNYSPMIYAFRTTNVAVTGGGVIDGNTEPSDTEGFGTFRPKQGPAQSRLRMMGTTGVPVEERVFGNGDYLRPSMIQFYESENVLLEGFTAVDSPFWVNHFVYTRNATLRNVTVDSKSLNNDGVDVDSSTNVMIEGNTFITGDDSVVVKSGRDQDGWRVGRPSENIIIRGNDMRGHNGLTIGSEMSGGVRNVFMENNVLGDVRSALYFKSNTDRGGAIEDIWARNITVGDADTVLDFDTNYKNEGSGRYPSLYRNFNVENVTAERAGTGIRAVGIAAQPIRDVLVRNVTINEVEDPLIIENVDDINLKNVWMNGERC
ncbi:glycoside hydrolase family 28 protein [Micromonospora yasonensis]|uniref:glycoside hydrolase family 28 protein n=1 Tax=Micromonospora yasonensis TaxID=1128667 RepID=UPI00222FEEC8|nr:glycoside hydrolase family 28 protein [Micromonospora yasonensis]MCW3840761.1 glycoside hydrolase family 28 protein [Micromonospora yasonensis]